MRCLVLDAMGVIFRAADDVAEILIPFIQEAGGSSNGNEIESAYLDASLGLIGPDEFWRKVGLDASVEDEYLSRHALMPRASDFLLQATRLGIPVWCLSNDIDRWSKKLRTMHEVDHFLTGSVISSEVNARKPDRKIFQCLLDRSGFRADELLFVDDRAKNTAAATAIGIQSLQFSIELGYRHLAERVFGDGLTLAVEKLADHNSTKTDDFYGKRS